MALLLPGRLGKLGIIGRLESLEDRGRTCRIDIRDYRVQYEDISTSPAQCQMSPVDTSRYPLDVPVVSMDEGRECLGNYRGYDLAASETWGSDFSLSIEFVPDTPCKISFWRSGG